MLRSLLAILAAPDEHDRMEESEARLALAALMVRAAKSDGDYEATERATILSALAEREGMSTTEAAELLRQAEKAEAEAPDTVRFTRLIKRAVPYEHRTEVMEALWKVALADGRRSPEEDALLRQLASLLGVTDQDSAMARHRAEHG